MRSRARPTGCEHRVQTFASPWRGREGRGRDICLPTPDWTDVDSQGETGVRNLKAPGPVAAAMRFRAEDVVRATPDQTFAWWTDLREDDAGAVMPPLRKRTVV